MPHFSPPSSDRTDYRRLLVFAPHPDDEVFGCGGMLASQEQAEAILVVILTDGAGGGVFADDENPVEVRKSETQLALQALGIAGRSRLECWGYPDQQLMPSHSLLDAMLETLGRFDPDLVLAPSPFELHPDHRVACLMAYRAWQQHCLARRAQPKDKVSHSAGPVEASVGACPSLMFYEVGHSLQPNVLVDITRKMARKRQAMACFASQLAEQAYAELIESLNRYRSYSIHHQAQYVEAFLRLLPGQDGDPQIQAALEGIAQELGYHPIASPCDATQGDKKVETKAGDNKACDKSAASIAVIVRTQWRPSLEKSLSSLAKQSHRPLVVVLVSASEPPGDWKDRADRWCKQPESAPVELLSIGVGIDRQKMSTDEPDEMGRQAARTENRQCLSRAEAINKGLEMALACKAQWIAFLDDDDQLHRGHFEGLLQRLENIPTGFDAAAHAHSIPVVGAYSGTRLLNSSGHWLQTLHQDWNRDRILRANFLPIHSVLFHRGLIEQGLRADEQFDLYEDWDFWIGLSRHGDLLCTSQVSADYFQRDDSLASGVALEQNRRAARQAIYSKWMGRLSAFELEAAFRCDELDVQQANSRSTELLRHAQKLEAQRNAVESQAQELALRAQHSESQLDEMSSKLQHAESQLNEMSLKLQHAESQLTSLSMQVQALESNISEVQRHLSEQFVHSASIERDKLALESALHQSQSESKELKKHQKLMHYENQQLHREVASREYTIHALRNSISWRASAPIRWFGRLSRIVLKQAYPVLKGILKPAASALGIPHPRLWLRQRFARDRKLDDRKAQNGPLQPAANTSPSLEPVSKAAIKAQAQAELRHWLAGSDQLDFRPLKATGSGATSSGISIVVVLFNQAGLTKRCLDSLLAHGQGSEILIDLELIIVDNASDDETALLLARIEGAEIIRNPDNLGFLRAANAAAQRASKDFLLFLNNDAELLPGSLEAALRRIRSDDKIQAVGGPVILFDGCLQEAGNIIWNDASCLGYGRGCAPDADEFQHQRYVDYVSGAFLLTYRARFLDMGSFSERFAPAYYEESDYCARLWQSGFRVAYDPLAAIRHLEFASSSSSDWAIAQQQKNQTLFQALHADWLTGQAKLRTQSRGNSGSIASDVALKGLILRARARPPGVRVSWMKAGLRRVFEKAESCPRVLVLDDRVPHAHLGSGFPRSRDVLKSLDALGCHVCFYPVTMPHDDWSAIRESLPPTVEVALNRGVVGLEAFLLERIDWFSHLLISRPHNMAIFRPIWEKHRSLFNNAHIIYDAEAIFTFRDASLAKLKGEILGADHVQSQLHKELQLASGVDCVTAVSEAEANAFRTVLTGNDQHVKRNRSDAPDAPSAEAGGPLRKPSVQVLGHLIEPRPSLKPFHLRDGVLFVGALYEDNTPNAESLIWFIDSVLPLLQAKWKAHSGAEITLDIVGLCKAPGLWARKNASIRLHGVVGDLSEFFNDAKIFIVPTRFAAGIPHKAHEAAARGLPMVVSSLIAGQLGWDHQLVKIADAAEDFAQACFDVLTDADRWDFQRHACLKRVAEECSAAKFEQAMLEALGFPIDDLNAETFK
ncbi:MAG: glycosyltransferase [Betaproteobacteria bacterium]|nr:glycosyltransferase [Betaproteobacteria bacterium]